MSVTILEPIIQFKGSIATVDNVDTNNCYAVFIWDSFNNFITPDSSGAVNKTCKIDHINVAFTIGTQTVVGNQLGKVYYSFKPVGSSVSIALPPLQKEGIHFLRIVGLSQGHCVPRFCGGYNTTVDNQDSIRNFDVKPNSTAPIITLDKPHDVTSNQEIILSGKLTDYTNKPISGATINFSFSSATVQKPYGDAITKDDGTYTLRIEPDTFSGFERNVLGFTVTTNTGEQIFYVTASYKKDGNEVLARRPLFINIFPSKSSQSNNVLPPPFFPPCKVYHDKAGNNVTNQVLDKQKPYIIAKDNYVQCVEADSAIGGISTDPVGFIKKLFAVLLSLAGGVVVIMLILSGYKLMMSSGNPEKVKEAQESITSAIVGLLFIIFSLVILQFIGVDLLHLPGFKPSP